MAKRNALGKGLGALIRQPEAVSSENQVNVTDKIDINKIEVNPYQPRTHFDSEALEELAASIKHLGIIQPITVRETDSGNYQIISGERRYRASQIAGLTEIPAYIRQADDNNMLELALVENIQREDLDAIEIAISYQRLIDECDLTQENVSERVGKKRSTIANYLRLLRLPAPIQLAIRQKKITMGHARALVNIEQSDNKLEMLEKIIENGLSVRQVEIEVQELNNPKILQKPEPEPMPEPEEISETKPEEISESKPEVISESTSEDISEPKPEDISESTVKEDVKIEIDNQDKKPEETVYEDNQPVSPVQEEQELKALLSKRLGAKVEVKKDATGAGRVIISFRTEAELQYIVKLTEKIEI